MAYFYIIGQYCTCTVACKTSAAPSCTSHPSHRSTAALGSPGMATTKFTKACGLCGKAEDTSVKLSACGRCGLEFYCNKDCQKAHWTQQGNALGHRLFCVAKADRATVPPPLSSAERRTARKAYASRVQDAAVHGKCVLCLLPFSETPGLNDGSESDSDDDSCPHKFHSTCVAMLQANDLCSYLQSVCPLCNKKNDSEDELPPQVWPSARSFEEGCRRKVPLAQKVKLESAAWSMLPAEDQLEANEVLQFWRDAASHSSGGHAGAQFALAEAYASGELVKAKHDKEALVWCFLAAMQGNHPRAWSALGRRFTNHDNSNTTHGPEVAVICWQRASAGGDVEGSYQLGCALSMGHGIAKDLKEAAKCHRVAAELGHAGAAAELGQVSDRHSALGQSEEFSMIMHRDWGRCARNRLHASCLFHLRKFVLFHVPFLASFECHSLSSISNFGGLLLYLGLRQGRWRRSKPQPRAEMDSKSGSCWRGQRHVHSCGLAACDLGQERR